MAVRRSGTDVMAPGIPITVIICHSTSMIATAIAETGAIPGAPAATIIRRGAITAIVAATMVATMIVAMTAIVTATMIATATMTVIAAIMIRDRQRRRALAITGRDRETGPDRQPIIGVRAAGPAIAGRKCCRRNPRHARPRRHARPVRRQGARRRRRAGARRHDPLPTTILRRGAGATARAVATATEISPVSPKTAKAASNGRPFACGGRCIDGCAPYRGGQQLSTADRELSP